VKGKGKGKEEEKRREEVLPALAMEQGKAQDFSL
jgi:hypothetical protein